LLIVKTPDEVREIINAHLLSCKSNDVLSFETVKTLDALWRVLHQDIIANENIPGFNRSTVDGYAVLSSDTFGCSESIPAVLTVKGEVLMGESADCQPEPGTCMIVSTGGEVPDGADAVVMHEFTEDFGTGMVGIQKPAAPGNNIIYYNDDSSAGDLVLPAGTVISPHDVGIISALGYSDVEVCCKPVVGVISTGDELVQVSAVLKSGQVRDVNTPMLLAAMADIGAASKDYGIIPDDSKAIRNAMLSAVESCDIVLLSGGSSAGVHDMTARIIEAEGELLFHGIAMKPGKPTILGVVKDKLIFGLPGHPVAAFMVTELFVKPLVFCFMGAELKRKTTMAILSEPISSNHGREEYVLVRLDSESGLATPIRSKSGLIASMAGIDGYICIARDNEGLAKGTEVIVFYF